MSLRSLLPASKLNVQVQTPDRDDEATPAPTKPEALVRMANLCVIAGNKVNGVAAIHTQIVKEEVFRDFYKVCVTLHILVQALTPIGSQGHSCPLSDL